MNGKIKSPAFTSQKDEEFPTRTKRIEANNIRTAADMAGPHLHEIPRSDSLVAQARNHMVETLRCTRKCVLPFKTAQYKRKSFERKVFVGKLTKIWRRGVIVAALQQLCVATVKLDRQ